MGGGTVDTTVHQVLEDGTLKELHAATGGPWGRHLVNKAFEKFIEKLVTPEVFRNLCKFYTCDWIELLREFERKKRFFSPDVEEIDLIFPAGIEQLYKNLTSRDLRNELKGDVELVGSSMILKPAIMKSFFGNATEDIIKHIASLLEEKKMGKVTSILLVGGFSESVVVSDTVNRTLFKETKHPEYRKKVKNGKAYVDNVFDKHIEKSEEIFVGGTTFGKKYMISTRKIPSVFWNVYQTEYKPPTFCDEEGCKYLGRLEITIPEEIKDQNVSLNLSMTCKGTELEARVVSVEHDLLCRAEFDFLAIDYSLGSDFIEFVD